MIQLGFFISYGVVNGNVRQALPGAPRQGAAQPYRFGAACLCAFGPAFFLPRLSWFKANKKLFAIPFVPTSLRPKTHRTIRFALRSFYKRKS